MTTSSQPQHQTAATWIGPSNRLDARPFEATDGAEVDKAPSALQSRPFASPVDQSIAAPDVQARLDENQQTDKLFDFTQVDLFAGAAPSEPPPTTPSVQRSKSSDSSDVELEGDRYEQEADQIATKVVSMPDSVVQRQEDVDFPVDSFQPADKSLQAKGGAGKASAGFEQRLQKTKGGGAPLDDDVRGFMEPRFGADFGQVRVHTGGEAVQLNKEVGAQAFTHGNDVYFNAGKYSPGSKAGKELLAHELTHTIQQTGGERFQAKFNSKSNKLNLKAKDAATNEVQPFQREQLKQIPGGTAPKSDEERQRDQKATSNQTLESQPIGALSEKSEDLAPKDQASREVPDSQSSQLNSIASTDDSKQESQSLLKEGQTEARGTDKESVHAKTSAQQNPTGDLTEGNPQTQVSDADLVTDTKAAIAPPSQDPLPPLVDGTDPSKKNLETLGSEKPNAPDQSPAADSVSKEESAKDAGTTANTAIPAVLASPAPAASGQAASGGGTGGGSALAIAAGGGGEVQEASVNEEAEANAMEQRLAAAAPGDESSNGQLSSAEKAVALDALAEDPVSGGAPAGGGGGGGAIAETETPAAPPDVSQADPSSAIASVSGLPPAQLLTALGGVTAAVANDVGQQKAELAANPPQADTLPGAETSAVPQNQPTGDAPKSVEKKAEGAEKPVPEPDPLPPEKAPPEVVTPPPAVQGNEEGKLSDADVSNMKSSLSQLPARDPGANEVSAGVPPTLTLEGNADPQKAKDQKAELESSLTEAEAKGRQELAQPTGAENIQQTLPQQTLKAQVEAGAGGATAIAAGAGAAIAAGVSGDGMGDAASIFAQQEKGAEIQAAAAKAQGDLAAKKQEHADKVAAEQATARQEIELLKQQNADQQAQEKAKAQGEVAGLQGQWSQEQNDLVSQSRKDSDKLVSEGLQEVETERVAGDQEAAKEVQKGEEQAEAERQKGEDKAATEKAKGEKESSGFFGWLASKAKAFFDGIKNAIKKAFEAARAAMRKAIEAAKKLAAAAIEKARKAIVAVIRRVGDALIALGDTLLAKWPGLRDKWQNAIEKRVQQAEDAVNALAAKLNEGIQKALDGLGAALDAALGLLEKGMLAVVSVYEGVVMGAIKAGEAIAKALGAFAVLAKDIAANPGQWISNLGSAVSDGIKNHLWSAFQEQVTAWFNQKLEQVLGLGAMVWKVLTEGGISMAEIGTMAWTAVKQALPTIIIGVLLERLVSMIVPAAGAVLAIIQGLQAAWGTVGQIIQAFGKFITFLKAIKTGAAGPQFGALLASAAVVLLDFITNFIIAKIAKAARKVAGKLKGLAKSLKKRFSRKKEKKGKKNKDDSKSKRKDDDKETQAQKKQRVDKAVDAAETAINNAFGNRGARAQDLIPILGPIKLQHRLTILRPVRKGNKWGVYGKINPSSTETTQVKILDDTEHKDSETPESQAQVPSYETPFKPLTPSQRRGLEAKQESRSLTQEEYKHLEWDRRFSNRRARGVRRFWSSERKKLKSGEEGTRQWTPEQRETILKGKTPKFDGESMEGHHKHSALSYPQLADEAGNIYPATKNEHFHRWHGGNYQNQSRGHPLNVEYPEEF